MKLSAIKRMELLARDIPDVVSLSQGTPFLASDPRIKDAASKALESQIVDRYSDPQGSTGRMVHIISFLDLRNQLILSSFVSICCKKPESLSLRETISGSVGRIILDCVLEDHQKRLILE